MKKTTFTKALSCILCVVLIAAMALCMNSCSGKNDKKEDTGAIEKTPVKFTVAVRDADGNEESFELESSKTYLLDALLDENMVEGEDQSAGFYIKKVNGITADYDIDGTYWALYIDGEYAMTGADTTPIEEGTVYLFAVE